MSRRPRFHDSPDSIERCVEYLRASLRFQFVGGNVWKRQLSGKTEYDVALRFLRTVYKLRDAILLVRSPFMSAGEVAHAAKESDPSRASEGSPLDWTKGTAAAYEQRWKSILESVSDIQLVAQEAEVLWGRRAVEILAPLRKSVGELRWALSPIFAAPKFQMRSTT